MSVEYELSIMDRAGVEQMLLVGTAKGGEGSDTRGGFLDLEYTKEVNRPGLLTFSVDADHDLVDVIDLDWQVAVRRRDLDQGIDWYLDFQGLFRGDERAADRDGEQTWRGFCPGYLHFLGRSVVAYEADRVNRTAFVSAKAETIMKDLVKYNATPSGTTADRRQRNVDGWGNNITIQADGAGGNTLDYRCFEKGLLESLQEVAELGGGDFDLVKTAPQGWQFRWYPGQLGTDRSTGSSQVVFSLSYENMENPRLSRNYVDYKTVVIVGGPGSEAERVMITRTGSDYETNYRSGEAFLNGSQQTTYSGLNAMGDLWLAQHKRERIQLDFDVVQTPSYLYGLHYFLGDKVLARFQNIEAVKKISRVTVTVRPSDQLFESIKLGTSDA